MTTADPVIAIDGRRGWWQITGRRARMHAVIVATVLWLVTLAVTFGGSGRTSLVGVLNAPDFVQFYTLGRLADQHRVSHAYDFQAFHDEQAKLVPESKTLIFPPVYPPQVAIAFIPLSRLPYAIAQRTWTAITILVYAVIVWGVWRAFRASLPDPILVFAAAAAFPPFFQTVIYGQVTILILAPCFLAWLALDRERHFAAGFALGFLAIKPQFGPVFAVVVLMRRDWRMLSGAVTAVALQLVCVWSVLGFAAFGSYFSVLETVVAHADALEAKPFQSHSIRAVTRLLPGSTGLFAWLIASTVVLWKTGRIWCSTAPLHVRFGVAMLAAVLVNPHLIVYDAAILVLPLLWFGVDVVAQRSREDAAQYVGIVYGLFLAFFIPTAAVVKVQASVLLMLWLFWKISVRDSPMHVADLPRRLIGQTFIGRTQ
jgi:hypothetical protein